MSQSDRSLEPFHPELADGFRVAADALVQETNRLAGMLAPATREGIAELVALINAYYSNLIEGHYTFPRDIEHGLNERWAEEPDARDYQAEGVAHVQVERIVKQELQDDPELDPASTEFLSWVHRLFYERLPQRFRVIETPGGRTLTVEPGELRTKGAIVGRHPTPDVEEVGQLLRAFSEGYRRLDRLHHPENLAAAFAAHHRLLWIQPFLDGNGRVARIMTQAHLYQLGLSGAGLWSLPRGLARADALYKQYLTAADIRRGKATQPKEELTTFCQFMADTALEQAGFMHRCLDLDALERRMRRFVEADEGLQPEVAALLWDMALRGRVPRNELPRILGVSEHMARNVTRTLIDRGLARAANHRAPLRLAFPTTAAESYFPRLFPAAAGA